MKFIHVALLECEDLIVLNNALAQIKNRKGINQLLYSIEDSKLRMILASLKEATAEK